MNLSLKNKLILVAAVLALSVFLVYPTVRWSLYRSDEVREQVLQEWQEVEAEIRAADGAGATSFAIQKYFQGDRDRTINLGLDLQGGLYMKLEVDLTGVEEEDKAGVVESVLRTVRNRVNEFGLTEPSVRKAGERRLVIQLPGVKDPQRVKDLLVQVAKLTFNVVEIPNKTMSVLRDINQKASSDIVALLDDKSGADEEGDPRVNIWFDDSDYEYIKRNLEQAKETGLLPDGYAFAFSGIKPTVEGPAKRQLFLMKEAPEVTGDKIEKASTQFDITSAGDWAVSLSLNSKGAREFSIATGTYLKRQMAIVLDGVVQSAPKISSKIPTGNAQITGGFSAEEATDLAVVLRSGSLQAKLIERETREIGPSLGEDSIRSGFWAAVIGLAIVVVFMIFHYRFAGGVAIAALLFNIVIVLGALAYFKATLTLPGIAGLILTIGMAVDANVLIFERIREELRKGKTLRASIEQGYNRAFYTILDSNVTTLITALVLFQFGTGPIKGFAVTLSIGIIASMFTSLIVTRMIFDIKSRNKNFTSLSMARIVGDTNIPFIGNRKFAYTMSAVLILIGLVVFFGVRGGDMYGIDFTEGTNIQVKFEKEVSSREVQSALASIGMSDAPIQLVGRDKRTVLIQAPAVESVITARESAEEGAAPSELSDQAKTVSAKIQAALAENISGNSIVKGGVITEMVSAQVGRELRDTAIKAAFFAIIGILVYISLRFQFIFAVAAVIALFHDVLFTLGMLAVFQREISLTVVAAILTIIGYSLNDTIVIFDRIREGLKLYREKPYAEILNLSVNQTLGRTLLTSLTTLIVVTALLIKGGPRINDFAFTLLVGIIVGTYSSVFVASPLLVSWREWVKERHDKSRR
ncbi:protein translocase subunit SecD [Candidatus Hydrogenedentota bacterium]